MKRSKNNDASNSRGGIVVTLHSIAVCDDEPLDPDIAGGIANTRLCGSGLGQLRAVSAKALSDTHPSKEMKQKIARQDIRVRIGELMAHLEIKSGLRGADFLNAAEMDRKTYLKLRVAAPDTPNERTLLSAFRPILRHTKTTIVLKLESHVPQQATLVFQYNGGDPKEFCANFFRQCRAVTGLNKKQLDGLLGKQKPGKADVGYCSKVERGTGKKGVTVNSLMAVAWACGFSYALDWRDQGG